MTISFGVYLVLGCFNLFCIVRESVCVGVLVICVPVFTVFLYCSYCVFLLFRICIFFLICFVCTSARTAATE